MDNYEVLAEHFKIAEERIHLWSDDSMTVDDRDTTDYYVVESGESVEGYTHIAYHSASDGALYKIYSNGGEAL